MRICGGSAKGMKLSSPNGMATRPMIERVKIAMFNIIGDEVLDTNVLDLFSGSGSLGLEAISRGAKFSNFVENGIHVLPALKTNLTKIAPGQHKLFKNDALFIYKFLTKDDIFDLIFMDPPYKHIDDPRMRTKTLEFLAKIVSSNGSENCLVVLHCRRYAMSGVPIPSVLSLESTRDYGSTELVFLRRVSG